MPNSKIYVGKIKRKTDFIKDILPNLALGTKTSIWNYILLKDNAIHGILNMEDLHKVETE